MSYNKKVAFEIVSKAEQTIKIINMILQGNTPAEIVLELGDEEKRTLVLYYFKRLSIIK